MRRLRGALAPLSSPPPLLKKERGIKGVRLVNNLKRPKIDLTYSPCYHNHKVANI